MKRDLDWDAWETVIRANGITIDRARHSVHPVHRSIIYPVHYGFVRDTVSSDGEGIDVFVGTADSGLVAVIWTTDHRKGDRECKFILDCTPEEVYLVNGFINFDRSLMEGDLVLRAPMGELWDAVHGVRAYEPIDCGFYDRLEHWAVRGESCEVRLESGETFTDRFEDFDNRPDGEFAVMASGRRVRLDRIATVNGVARPGSAC